MDQQASEDLVSFGDLNFFIDLAEMLKVAEDMFE